MDTQDTATLLAQMLRGFQTPPRAITLHNAFTGTTRLELKQFAREVSANLLDALNLELLRQLTEETLNTVRADAGMDYGTLALNTDEPDFKTVQHTLGNIYTNLSLCQRQREQIQHYLTVLKNAETYLKTFRNGLEQFVLDEDVAPAAYTHLSERKRAFDAIAVDLDAYATTLAQLRQDLTGAIDNVISPRNQLLLRAESSLRLLAKFAEQDSLGNAAQSRPRTNSPREPFDSTGFVITPDN